MQYSKVRKWEVAPNTFAATNISFEDLHKPKPSPTKPTLKKARVTDGAVSQPGELKSAAVFARVGSGSRSSIPKFENSPSGQVLSENPARVSVQRTHLSHGRDEYTSLSPKSRQEPRSPFTAKSGGKRSIGTRVSGQQVISVTDQMP